MGRGETERKPFYTIKNVYKTKEDEAEQKNGWPRFFYNNQNFGWVSGLISHIDTEIKDIIPTKGQNAGKTITIQNLLVSIIDQEGEIELQVPLYSQIARSIMNALAGPEELNEVFFSVYNNNNGFRSISLKHSTAKDDFITPKYTWDEQVAMVETVKVKGKDVKDYDSLTDDWVKILIPIIREKINKQDLPTPEPITSDDEVEIEKGAKVPLGESNHDMPQEQEDDDLPF